MPQAIAAAPEGPEKDKVPGRGALNDAESEGF
jgi:hypothetical protein